MGMHRLRFCVPWMSCDQPSVLLCEPLNSLQFAKSPPSRNPFAFVRLWALTATQIAMNQCFYFSNPYASQLAWYKSSCGQFTLKWDIHLPADFTAVFLDQCIQNSLFLLLKNDYNVVTNPSRLYFSTGVGWCLFWLASHCIIYTVHASSWQNSQLNQNNSPDVCRNLLCTLFLVRTAYSFFPHTPPIPSPPYFYY